ncbi:carboxymuconolactone decarboxylase family protein [Agromyces seonyuensis]|uniref:Carboxymuconolactone decarboxylase family protein n=1 Tax=Agromyces seonyuensis TaxID=2662446 RepID=A0A6I4P5I6_9MICO|nr:carboxymuconolactone decarboxylase family protein [Agromyces seonyuensis]MWB98694.1 carboxymuconolactone decarboxylase family protein [Agromyces seonyuensis]
MTTATRIPTAEVDGLQGAIVKYAATKMTGKVPDSLGVLWHHKKLMRDTLGVGRKVEAWKELDPQLASYAAISAAAFIGCSMCLDLNYFLAHDHGLDEEKAREVPRWRESSVFTPLERNVMAYAEAASQTPPAVTDELSDALLAEIGPAGLVELAARVGFMNLSARMNIALGIHSEGFADACGLPPIRMPASASSTGTTPADVGSPA